MRELKEKTPTHHLTFILLLWMLLPTRVVTDDLSSKQHFQITPASDTVNEDEQHILGCIVNNMECDVDTVKGNYCVQWLRDGFGLGNLSYYDRYKMTGNQKEGDFSFVINPVKPEDNGIFECQIMSYENTVGVKSKPAELTVLSPPQNISISMLGRRPGGYYHELDIATINCTAIGGNPKVTLTWFDGSGQELTDNVTTTTELHERQGRIIKTISILRFIVQPHHHNKYVTCLVENERGTKFTQVLVQTQYAPLVELQVAKIPICEYDNVKLTCDAYANPPVTTYRWYQDNELIFEGLNQTTWTFYNVTRSSETWVKCQAENDLGSSTHTKYLTVTCYAPSFVKPPQTAVVDKFGDNVTLSCDLTGSPTPVISWFHGSTKLNFSGPNLTVIVSPRTLGRYKCEAVVLHYPPISAVAYVHVKGPPRILSYPFQSGTEGDQVRLECKVYSVPEPDIAWYHRGVELDMDNSSYEIIQEKPKDDGTVMSILVINATVTEDFGSYNCSVSNGYGFALREIYLQENFRINKFYIIIPVAIVAVLSIMITVIACRRNKREEERVRKQEEEERINSLY